MSPLFRTLACTLFIALSFSVSPRLHARDMLNRMGVGLTNQTANDLPAISFKIQKSNSFGIGGLFAWSTDDVTGGYAAGLKIYRLFFDEPQLNFYGSILGALIKKNGGAEEGSGFQADMTLGSEFSFQGLDSIGFSFEFGLSMSKIEDFVVETAGYHFITAGIHFYL